MKNKLATNLKKITSYVLALSIVFTSFGFVPAIQASPVGPVVTIGSQSASNGATINVPVNASNFTDVAGITLTGIQFDNTLLSYTGYTLDILPVSGSLVNLVGNQVNINWSDFANPLNVSNNTLLTLNFTVISAAITNTNLTFVGIKEINDSVGDTIAATFVDGVISLNPAKAITAFSFPEGVGVINEGDKTVAVTVPFSTNVTALTPTIIVSAGASVSPLSGVAQNFTNPVTYTVTAADSSTQAYLVTITVTVNPDIAAVAADKAALVDGSIQGTNSNLSNITVALTNPLPSLGANGSTITWVSNTPAVVSNDGQTVVRPAFGAGNATVTMTATIAKGVVTDTKVFTLTVLAEIVNPDIAKVVADKAALVSNLIQGTNSDLANIITVLSNPLPASGSNGSAITWESSNTAIVSNDGQTVVRPAFGAGNATVTLTATLTKGIVTDTKAFILTVLAETVNPDTALVAADKAALVDNSIKGANPDLSNITVSLTNPLPSLGTNGSTITWVSNTPAVVSNDGQIVNRPAFGAGNTTITMTATIIKGIVTDTKVFTLTVIKLPASTIATVTSGTYAVSAGGTASETIINIPFGTSKADFLAALTKGEVNQTWDDTGIANPVVTGNTLVVMAEDGIMTVTYTVAVALNPAKAITAFSFPEGVGVINEGDKTVAVTVPFGTNVTALVPTVTITGASVNPASGVAQDFTSPVTYTVTAADATTQIYLVTVTVALNTAKAITSFNFTTPLATGVINEGDKTIAVAVPYGTDVTSLVPTIAISGSLISPLSDVAQDFTNPVTYTVTAADSSTQSYVVTVATALNPAKAITAFSFSEGAGVVDEGDKTIAVTVPFGTNVTALVPTVTITGASVNPASGVAQDFTSPVTYTVTAADATTQIYTITVTVSAPSNIATVTSATYTVSAGGTAAETITNISFGTTKDTFLAALVKGHSGQTWIDTGLSNPVVTGNTLVVTAQDGTTVVTYTLTVALNPAKSITSFNFASPSVMGVINETAHTITLTVPYGTDVTALIPTIAVSAGATVNPASAVPQDFTNPVTYTITAADSSTQNYVVSINVVTATQTVPAADGTATANSTTPQVVVSSPTQAVAVTVSSGTSNASINYGSLISGGTGTIPQTTIDTTSADIAISASTVVTSASTTWDGVITAPTVTTVTLPETSGQTKTLSTAIEIGFTGAKLSFNKAVRILLPGQAGKRAGYVRAGTTFTEITNTCAADNQTTGDALVVDGECKIDVGSDMVIWTKHFTSFATYTQTVIPTVTPPNTGGGGGGGGAPSDTSVPTNTSITINNGAATTTSRTVTLTLSASDSSSIQMAISNNSAFSGGSWENYSTSKSWQLTGENGIKTVYVKFKDTSNNTSSIVSDSIVLNTTEVVTVPTPEPSVLGVKITDTFNDFILAQKSLLKKTDKALTQRLAGKILLQVQDHGEAWYVDMVSQNRFYLADGAKAYGALRKFGLGITNKDLAKIPVGIEKRFLDTDTDADGLADKLEEGLGTDKNKKDTDGDGVSDYDEVVKNQTNPLGAGKLVFDNKLLGRLKGRIVLQIESRGEAWYINPADGKRYYMKDGGAAYQIMRFLSLGITNENIRKINIGD